MMKWLRRFWGWNRTLGLGGTVVVNISLWNFSYFLFDQISVLGFRYGWWKSESHFSWNDFAVATITGCLTGLFEFSDKQKAQETAELKATGKDRTMI
jgi:hypothetical protein